MHFMYLWFIYSFIQVIWADDKSSWFKYMFFFLIGIISILLFLNYINSKEDVYKVMSYLNLGIFIQSIIGWYEMFTGNYMYITQGAVNQYTYWNTIRVPVAMQFNPNDFALLMMLGIVITLVAYNSYQNKLWKIITLVFCVNYAVLLVLTRSRGMILALGIGICYIIITDFHKKIGFILLGIVLLFAIPDVFEFIMEQFMHSESNQTSDTLRMNLYKNGLLMFTNSYGFGIGLGQVSRWLSRSSVFSVSGIEALHNWWLEILASSGFIFFIGYIKYYYGLFKSFTLRKKHILIISEKRIAMVLSSFLLSFAAGCLSCSTLFTSEVFWFVWGVLICLQGIYDFEYLY